jgi:hypothetical protein
MTKKLATALGLAAASAVLGATVLREPVAWAAAPITNVIVGNTAANPVPVREQNLDANGHVKVHEQGTADVNVKNAVKLDPAGNTVQLAAPAPFHAYEFIDNPAAAGGRTCVPFGIPAGEHARIDTVTVVTYGDPAALAYVRFFVREGPGVSRIMTQRILTNANGNDPVADTRNGVLEWGANVSGGGVADLQDGEAHSVAACIQSSAAESASGAMMLDGVKG